jgi:ribonuclease HI
MEKITIFTDGAAKGNPGPGGYGAVILLGDRVLEIGEGKVLTTNNEMELRAVVEALKNVPADAQNAEIYTDSKYVVEGATGWTFGWMKNENRWYFHCHLSTLPVYYQADIPDIKTRG